MNIKELYDALGGTLPECFEKSMYVLNIPKDFGEMLKTVIVAYTNEEVEIDNTEDMSKQLSTGGIGKKQSKKTDKDKKWSFCSEIIQMTTNFIGLFKLDISKQLYVLIGIKQILQNMINDISNAINYNRLTNQVNAIMGLFSLKSEGQEAIILNTDTFNINTYLENQEVTFNEEAGINGNYISSIFINEVSSENYKKAIEEYIHRYIDDRYKTKVESLNSVKNYIKTIFNDMLLNSELGNYRITNINQLCINLGEYDICYSPSFIKCFEVGYNETFGDIPFEDRSFKPYADFIEKINNIIGKTNNKSKPINLKSISEKLLNVYKDVFTTVKESAISFLGNNVLNIYCTNSLFQQLIDVTIHEILMVGRCISNKLIASLYCGNSTRTQFVHILEGVLETAPKYEIFNKSQRMILYWVLMNEKPYLKTLNILTDATKASANE